MDIYSIKTEILGFYLR